MAYKIVWSEQAITSFDRIIKYLEENFSKKEVASFILTTNKRLVLISLMPKLSRLVTKSTGRRKAIIHKRTVLFYRIKQRRLEVELLSFLDTRRSTK